MSEEQFYSDFEAKESVSLSPAPDKNKVRAEDLNGLKRSANAALFGHRWAFGQLHHPGTFTLEITNSTDYFEVQDEMDLFPGSSRFENDSGWGLTYSGDEPRYFVCNGICSVAGPSNKVLEAAVLKNGVPLANSVTSVFTGQGGRVFGTISRGFVRLETGDTIKLGIKSPNDSSVSLEFRTFNLGVFPVSSPELVEPAV